jgi:hypothetical protein
MYKTTQAITVVALMFGASSMSHAATIHVPGDYDTIQEAIIAANDNDTIVVHPGTYREGPLDLRGKILDLVGDAGPQVTKILMDTGSVSSVIMITGEQPSVSITGFTISGGTGENGVGGGITVDSPTYVLVQNCWITGNYADDKGGGIYASAHSQMSIQDCLFMGNISATTGGGAHLECNEYARISRCAFLGNFAGLIGGGLQIGSEFAMKKSMNLYADSCLFSGNVATVSGAGMAATPPAMMGFGFCGAINCTFSGNVSPSNPAVATMPSMGFDSAVVQNSILSNNVGSQMILGLSTNLEELPPTEFDTCLIDTLSDVDIEGLSLFAGIAAFVDEFGPDGIAGTGDEDLELTPLSAAIDQGTDEIGGSIGSLDLFGKPRRIDDPLVLPDGDPEPLDLGALEYDIESIAGSVAIWNAPGQSNIDFLVTDNWFDDVLPEQGVPGFIRLPGTLSHALVDQEETTGNLFFDGGSLFLTAPNGPSDEAVLRLIDEESHPGFFVLDERPGESTYVFLREVGINTGFVYVEDGELHLRNTSMILEDGSLVIRPGGEVTLTLGTSIEMVGYKSTVINNGILSVDGSSFDANYTQAAGGSVEDIVPAGTLIAEISAEDDSLSDPKLQLSGGAILGGTLGISASDSSPVQGVSVPILSASTIESTFDVLFSAGLPDGLAIQLHIEDNLGLGTSDVSIELVESSDTTFGKSVFGSTSSDGIEDAMLADVDNDGDDDLILSLTVQLGSAFGFVVILENFGTGSGGTWQGFDFVNIGINTVKLSGSANGFSMGDIDNDNLIDIVIANKEAGTVHLLQNLTTGAGIEFSDVFNTDSSPELPPGLAQPIDTWIGDLDGDGLRDVVVSNETDGSNVVFKNTSSFSIGLGPGNNSPSPRVSKGFSPTGTGSPRDEKPASIGGSKNGNGTETEGADDDGDENAGSVQTSKVTAGFHSGIRLEWTEHEVGGDPVDIAVEDLDGDGLRDIVTANRAGESVSILLGALDSEFEPALTIPVGASCESIGIGDFDADGDLDIAVLVDTGGEPKSVRVLRNDTDISGMLAFCLESDSLFDSNDAFKINVGNLDEDGHDDIVVQALSASLNGLTPQMGWVATTSGVTTPSCLGDIDQNGVVDAVDLAYLLGAWGPSGSDIPEDINGDSFVDAVDLAYLLGAWGDCNSEGIED